MNYLINERQQKLLKIEKKRNELANYLESGLITEKDIIDLIKKDVNYGIITYNVGRNPKKSMLKNIFNCPFLLCDQDCLSDEMKALLPYLLSARYEIEKNNLNFYLEQNFIDENDYNKELDDLKFFYYESSEDGKSILETGNVVFKDNNAQKKM